MKDRTSLIYELSESGYVVTARQLQDWAAESLIPKPVLKRQGRGKGVVALYPDEIVPQIVCLVSALSQNGTFDHARLALWRAGYPVNVRGLFERGIAQIRQFQQRVLEDRAAVIRDDGEYITLDEEKLNLRNIPLLRRAHKKVSGKGLSYKSLVFLITTVHAQDSQVYAVFDDERKDDMAVVQALISTAVPAFKYKPLSTTVYKLLHFVGEHLQADNLEETLSVSNDAILRQAANDLDTLILAINAVYLVFASRRGAPNKPPITFEHWRPEEQIILPLVFHSLCRTPKIRAGVDAILTAHHENLASHT
jgi:hypothetical protein